MPPGRPPKSPKKGNTPSKASMKAASNPPPSAPILTQEEIERELQAIATRARNKTWLNWAKSQARILNQAAVLLCLAGLYSTVSLLTLSPVYGSYPSAIHHSKLVTSALFVGWSANLHLNRWLRRFKLTPRQLLPVIAIYIPTIQYFLFQLSGKLGVKYGPVITETLTFAPLLILSISTTASLLDDLDLPAPSADSRWRYVTESLPGILSYALFQSTENLSKSFISGAIGQTFFLTRLGMQILLSITYTLFAPSKLLLYALPAILHTALFNTHVPVPYMTDRLNSTLHSSGWSLLERKESITGYISVIEKEGSFTALRCDHSILGGEWLQKAEGKGGKLGMREPIYGVFVMLEAVRLVEREENVEDEDASALVIGYGIGTTPTALVHHGIDTTIVEIDPVVYEFATKYFGVAPLPPEKVILQDAITHAAQLVQQQIQYDYIVHDVFTGGAEPVELFTYEFLKDLHDILKPGGVIAMNYAGDISLPPFHTTLLTIHAIFPRSSCRIYRESAPPSLVDLAHDKRDFTNMVIFCIKDLRPSSSSFSSPSSSPSPTPDTSDPPHPGAAGTTAKPRQAGALPQPPSHKLRIRKPTKADCLGSKAREMFLEPKFELALEGFGPADGKEIGVGGEVGLLYRNQTRMMDRWVGVGARGHWEVMRGVVEEGVWIAW